MRFLPQAGITDLQTDDGPSRRRRGRMSQEAVVCGIGVVLDLSVSGMRVECRRAPSGPFKTFIRGLGMEIEVKAQVVWVRRIGLFERLVGIEFMDVSPDVAERITQLAMTNRHRRAV